MKKYFLFVFLLGVFLAGLVLVSANEIDTCVDSEGGIEYYIKGITEGEGYNIDIGGEDNITRTDTCIGADFYGGGFDRVNEWICKLDSDDGKEYVRSVADFPCPNGCGDGACIKEGGEGEACIDSDDGENSFMKGITKGFIKNGDGSDGYGFVTRTDECIHSGDPFRGAYNTPIEDGYDYVGE